MAGIIQPKVLKGFRDFLPTTEIPRRHLIRALEDHFSSYGYVPIDTPVLEYAEILLSKGGGETDKQTYRFTDHGGRDVSLRFDLTVPFARFVSAHKNELAMPFRRYHIAKAWRGENTQKGRYREFIQCDFDIVGTDSATADLEIMLMMAEGLRTLKAGEVTIRFNHRGLFNLLLEKLGIGEKTAEVLRIVDKLAKIGEAEVQNQLSALVGDEGAETLLDFIVAEEDNRATLAKMIRLAGAEDTGGNSPLGRLEAILAAVEDMGESARFTLDPSITRGLDYYTGIVFETFLTDLPRLGSVCSGGRYDNLTGLFMKEPVTGVGASIGLDRLMAGLEELGRLESASSNTDLLVMMLDESLMSHYQKLAQSFRAVGVRTEIYPEAKKMGAQFKFAESKGAKLALIVGGNEHENAVVTLKDLEKRENHENLSLQDALTKAQNLLTHS
ncbi:MAG: histidine--tRNA ligase [Spirochaetales bacterium]|nr:histidine--tRNA ligase [Spirochaetales bacterium]